MTSKSMKNLLDPWSTKTLQELRTLYVHLRSHNVTMDEFCDYVRGMSARDAAARAELARKRAIMEAAARTCPECSYPMYPHPVNTGPADNVGGGFRAQWFCVNCGNSFFTRRAVSDILEEAEGLLKQSDGGRSDDSAPCEGGDA